jgi:hypothetical protein
MWNQQFYRQNVKAANHKSRILIHLTHLGTCSSDVGLRDKKANKKSLGVGKKRYKNMCIHMLYRCAFISHSKENVSLFVEISMWM